MSRTAYRRLGRWELPFADDRGPFRALEPGFEVVRLLPEDLGPFRALRPDVPVGEVRRRLAAGEVCGMVVRDGRAVHAGWAARDRVWVAYLGATVALGPQELFIHDSWTAPEARGAGHGTGVLRALWETLGVPSTGRYVSLVLPENGPGVRVVQRRGYARVGTVHSFGFGPWRRIVRRPR